MNETGPEEYPDELPSFSLDERREERFDPAPDPYLNNIPSVMAKPRIERMSS